MATPLHEPLSELLAQLSRREISAVELMERTLARIGSLDEKINAFCVMRDGEELLQAAREADARIDRGEMRDLEGIPLGVKELEDAEGFATTQGSVPFKDNMPERDSVQVERLKAAGAIVVGKTNAPEFGYTAITKNLLFGVTHNPWNLEHTPGGSSGGSSAAIAAGMIPLVTGSDGGGSVRLPATFTGCYGLKPSLGRIPNAPHDAWIMRDTVCHGPITRTVEDAAIHMDVVSGPHSLDPNSLPPAGVRYREILQNLPAGLRIGYSPNLDYGVVQSDVADVCAEAVHVFEELGHKLELVRGGPPELGYQWGLTNAFETAGHLADKLPEHENAFGKSFIRGVKAGWKVTPDIFYAANREREKLNRWCAEVFKQYDLLCTPTTIFDPPPARGPFPEEIEGQKVPWASVGSFTIPFNLSWHPAATVRAGFSKAKLPVGLQIVGPRHRDDLVLQASYAFEQVRPWHSEWPNC